MILYRELFFKNIFKLQNNFNRFRRVHVVLFGFSILFSKWNCAIILYDLKDLIDFSLNLKLLIFEYFFILSKIF